MTLRILPFALLLTCLAAPGVFAAEPAAENRGELQNRIEQLEKQIRELKELREKQQQKDVRVREIQEPCIAAVGMREVCSCLAENLPMGVDFTAYVRMVSAPKEGADERVLAMVKAARERCVK
ncbi:hypothetical protein KIP69_16300 [Geobacter sulfurreducens]|jgi:hypothetical protein|uniref:Uncharacterized protein n=1 Tax=Geobacter sulfurreducens (strain ATCC 51573 / DSM 12127 / PCA) TaxID=243231 RepID=Q747C2_GEOSL|nr:hypothetical protein [Geobacter sulfurreducens]AAR36735.1 hypothetical protein GSU3345 [Geobacter sulfurreducens PCA]ADI86101.1 hypothetical protein KN400_3289 [Geobacter sulfurreducens KN400]AJY69572.1 hypothetical protein RW64_08095 [Geobacter sulfurreducens]QVW35127.1 hypothetical protein KIP69_16300 [Geobacter sulfurreducens]UAC03995.1 hypothetical protein KVP06_16820 [Geobacter sulfurreducens]